MLSNAAMKEGSPTVHNVISIDKDACHQIVDVILTADLYGIESHGIQRMQRYHNSLIRKLVDVNAKPEIVHETPLSAVIEANQAIASAFWRSYGAPYSEAFHIRACGTKTWTSCACRHITTIAQDWSAIGRTVAELLYGSMEKPLSIHDPVVIPTRFVEGNTIGPAPRHRPQ